MNFREVNKKLNEFKNTKLSLLHKIDHLKSDYNVMMSYELDHLQNCLEGLNYTIEQFRNTKISELHDLFI